ncbi:MAG: LemA family protein [Alloprevotella sp.]|nr:LemA family protein [Alloprevotella sp.]
MKTLSKGVIALIVLVVAAVALAGWYFSTRNELVSQDESVSTSWANVQSQYQRRADLIPNLVETVKGYAKHEEGTFTAVVEARAKATQVTVDPTNLTPEKLKEFQAAQGELSSALGRLLALQENYPELKANEQFSELQAQLEGTENRINKARDEFNNAVQGYNLKVRQFPSSIVASMAGFGVKTKFEADAAAQTAPKVSFN